MAEATTLESIHMPNPSDPIGPAVPPALREQLQDDVNAEHLSPLDPDFVVFAVPTAISLDALGIIGALLYFTGAAPLFVTIINIFIGAFLILWMWWRTGRVDNALRRAQEILEEAAASGGSKEKKAVRTARLAYTGRKYLGRILLRFGLATFANLLPLLGFIPFWSIFLYLTFRENKSLSIQEE